MELKTKFPLILYYYSVNRWVLYNVHNTHVHVLHMHMQSSALWSLTSRRIWCHQDRGHSVSRLEWVRWVPGSWTSVVWSPGYIGPAWSHDILQRGVHDHMTYMYIYSVHYLYCCIDANTSNHIQKSCSKSGHFLPHNQLSLSSTTHCLVQSSMMRSTHCMRY